MKLQDTPVYRKIANLLRSYIKIRQADENDLKRINLWLYPKYLNQPVSIHPNTTNFIAEKGKKIVGTAQLVRFDNDKYGLFSLMVKPLYRRMGIGTSLSRAIAEKAKAEGAKELSLIVRKDNYRAIHMNQKLGFKDDQNFQNLRISELILFILKF